MKQIVKKPLISEKSFSLTSNGKYTFVADILADKSTAKEFIEKMFKVKVLKVNVINLRGKVKTLRGIKGKRSDLKKFIFSLKPNQKIDLFEAEKEDKVEKKSKDDKKKSKSSSKTK